jgi:hypothetical protein
VAKQPLVGRPALFDVRQLTLLFAAEHEVTSHCRLAGGYDRQLPLRNDALRHFERTLEERITPPPTESLAYSSTGSSQSVWPNDKAT